MPSFVFTLLTCSVTMSALAFFYMVATPYLAKRYLITWRYYAWLVIVIGLIIPFRPKFTNTIIKVAIPSRTAVPIVKMGKGPSASTSVEPMLHSALHNISWWQIAAAVWLVGMILFLAYHIIKHCHFLKLAARWSNDMTDEQALTLFKTLKTQMGLTSNISIQTCDIIGSPMMTGFVNPHILLPNADFTKDELCFILKHELVHYRRRDLWYKSLVLIATAVHWFNPIVYLMAKVIDIQCELSCDEEVVRNAGADRRQYYIETIIGVVRYQSKLKTALSTNFYGGRKGMKARIISIMDMKKKKSGFAVLCSVFMLTLGTGAAFAENAERKNPLEIINENIVIAPQISVGFLPDPDVYDAYAFLGITISSDGRKLLYEGQPVRLFADDKSENETFYMDEAGSGNLSVVRDSSGKIAGIERMTAQKAQEYQNAFFADEFNDEAAVQKKNQSMADKYDQYQTFGITYSAADEVLYFNGQRVKMMVDKYKDGWFGTYWTDHAGIVNVEVIRDGAGQITGIETMSDEKVQGYRSEADKQEQGILDGLDQKIEKRVKALYPEN